MSQKSEHYHLLKFLYTSAFCFFVGTVHGVLQVIRPIRAWLDSIGSPYGGPGHMIDPLAHAHINVVGGVVVFIMGATYYLLPKMSGVEVYSKLLIAHTYWWTVLGITGFYSTLMIFGYWEGINIEFPEEVQRIHAYYGPIISVVSTIMGIGFWTFFTNVFLTARKIKKHYAT